MSKCNEIPKLPILIGRKIYKTGQTRGADDDEIYQNRVSRSSTVLIPYNQYSKIKESKPKMNFENGFIVLINPITYHNTLQKKIPEKELIIGENILLFYETREHWLTYNPDELNYTPADSRKCPLGGQYIARIPATTAIENGEKINFGFINTSKKGAGIRAYEYADIKIIKNTRIQLETVFWLCKDSINVIQKYGMNKEDAEKRKELILQTAEANSLLDYSRLIKSRILNSKQRTICPLCLEELSIEGFFTKMEQAEGREVVDLTVTQLNLFHIEELRYGVFNHCEYNLGWGHHHCNIVVKDAGIAETLKWMETVIRRNKELY